MRPARQYEMCSLPSSVNVPLSDLRSASSLGGPAVSSLLSARFEAAGRPPPTLVAGEGGDPPANKNLYCICRRGVASREACEIIRRAEGVVDPINVRGGLNSWHFEVDKTFPLY